MHYFKTVKEDEEPSTEKREGTLPDKEQFQCILCWTTIVWVTQALTQTYMPLVPLLVTVELDQPPEIVGQVFTSFMIGTLVCSATLEPMCRTFSTKTVMMISYMLRIVAGIMWLYWFRLVRSGGAETGSTSLP